MPLCGQETQTQGIGLPLIRSVVQRLPVGAQLGLAQIALARLLRVTLYLFRRVVLDSVLVLQQRPIKETADYLVCPVRQHGRGPLRDLAKHGYHIAAGELAPLDGADLGQDIPLQDRLLSLPGLSAPHLLRLDKIGRDGRHGRGHHGRAARDCPL